MRLDRGASEALNEFRKEIESGQVVLSQHAGCPQCDGQNAILISAKDRLGLPCDSVVCEPCGLVYNNSYMDTTLADHFYSHYWGRIHWAGDPQRNFVHRTKPDAYSWKRFAFVCLALGEQMADIRTVFEIGCGDGCNLLPYHCAGKQVVGCDLDEDFLLPGREQGMDLMVGRLEQLAATDRKADLVILSHVFEHMLDLDAMISQVRALLRPPGWVYVEVPGILNWNRTTRRSRAEDGYRSGNNFLSYLQFQHTFHFDLQHLRTFWERGDFYFYQGDEWVRALFTTEKQEKVVPGLQMAAGLGDSVNKPQMKPLLPGEQIVAYLRDIEKDYQSSIFQLYRGARFLGRKLQHFFDPASGD